MLIYQRVHGFTIDVTGCLVGFRMVLTVLTIEFWCPDFAEAASRSAFSEAQLVPEDIQWFGLYVAWCGRGG